MEYREKLYKAFKGSQQRYLQRKGLRSVPRQRGDLVSLDDDEGLYTVSPKNPNLALQKRRILKETRGVITRVVDRYFVLDNELMTYFSKEKDSSFKKHISLEEVKVDIQVNDKREKWHDKSCDFRVQIKLQQRNFEPVYYYTNDMNEAKALQIRLKASSVEPEQKLQMQDSIQSIMLLEAVMRFFCIWNRINKVYEKRLLKMISFQLMGINLIEVAATAWFHRERMFKFWSNKILKRQKKQVLRSTLKHGEIKNLPLSYKSSLLIREHFKRIINLFKNRRLLREVAIQNKLDLLNAEQERGIVCNDIQINVADKTIKQMKIGRIRVDNQKYLQIDVENIQNMENESNFFETNKALKFSLNQISYLAITYLSKQKNNNNNKKEMTTIRIYGRTTSEKYDESQDKNIIPFEMDMDFHRRIPKDIYTITIQQIEIPLEFAKRFNQKGDLRVKIRQVRNKDNIDKSFYVKSKPFRIEVPTDLIMSSSTLSTQQKSGQKVKQMVILKCEDTVFNIDKLNEQDDNEFMKISLVLNRNSVPMKGIMKELLQDEEFRTDATIKYLTQLNAIAKIYDSKNQEFQIKYTIKKTQYNPIINLNPPQEREGLRLLIGRYVLYDKKKVCQVKALNKDSTVDLLVQTKEFAGIPQRKIQLIERFGVNCFDINQLPYFVQNSTYSWVIEFKTKNQRLLNLILSGIRNQQAQKTIGLRSLIKQTSDFEQLYEIEGNLLTSIIEGRSLNVQRGECNPFVKLSMSPKFYNKQGFEKQTSIEQLQFETHVVQGSTNPIWVNKQYPVGRIFDLGIFLRDKEPVNIKFEVFSRVQNKKDVLLGVVEVLSSDLIDINDPAKEKCLILQSSSTQSQYSGFLIIQVFFIPKKSTRQRYEIIEDLAQFNSAEQYFHYQYLQKYIDFDQHLYMIPISQFNPILVENSTTLVLKRVLELTQKKEQKQLNLNKSTNSLLLKKYKSVEKMQQATVKKGDGLINNALSEQEYDILNSKSPLLLAHDKTPDKASNPQLVQLLNLYCSPEEVISLNLKNFQTQRPDLEEGVLIFKQLWKYRVFQARQESFMDLQLKFWNIFLKENVSNFQINKPVQIDDLPDDILNTEQSFTSEFLESHYKKITKRHQSNWFNSNSNNIQSPTGKSNSNNQQQQLMLRNLWDSENDQRYADVFHLIQSGIPNDLRVIVWKDLLNVAFLEFQETKIFQQKNSVNYDSSKTIYQNYKELSLKSDCLAFRQIDEDIENFNFPQYFAANLVYKDRQILLNQQKRQMRNILRVLMLWSKEKKIDGKPVSYSYTKGLIQILQRLVNLSNEEDAFWILNGIMRPIPRLFSTEVSCLEGGRQSVLRNEMTIFKAILRENLPNICDKLRMLGLPVEYLIYDSIGSLYCSYFSSEIVFRLWDLIIFNMSTKDKAERRRAVWYIMSPAYLILREKQDELLNCATVQQVIDVYNNASSLTYNPDWIINQLRQLIKETFVTGAQRFQESSSLEQSSFKFGLSMINSLISKGKAQFLTDKAQLLEQTRGQFEKDLGEIFDSIEQENRSVGQLLEMTNYESNQGQVQYLDYVKWRTHVMAKFKKVALKNSDEIEDDLYEFDEPDLNKENLDLSKINIYLHQIANLQGLRLYKLKLSYGKLNSDQNFQNLEFYDSGDVYSSLKIQQYHVYDYLEGYNYIKIEILDPTRDDETFSDFLIDLRQVSAHKFVKRWFQMRGNETQNENAEAFRFPFPAFEVSLFLQKFTEFQHNEIMSKKNTTMSQFINSIKRKLPDRVDIFNKQNETDFVSIMQGDFKRIIQEEFRSLQCFLSIPQAQNTINDHYNYVAESDFGDLTLDNLEYLVSQCFFQEWADETLANVYRIFVKEKPEGDEEQEKFWGNKTNQFEKSNGSVIFKQMSTDSKKQPQNAHGIVNNKAQNQSALTSGLKLSSNRSLSSIKTQRNNSNKNGTTVSKYKDNLEGIFDYLPIKKKQQIVIQSKVPFSLRNFLVSLVLMSHCTMHEKFDILFDLFDWNDGVADGLDQSSIFLLLNSIFERNLYYWPSHELYNVIELSFDPQNSVSGVYQAFWTREPSVTTLHSNQGVGINSIKSGIINLKDFMSATGGMFNKKTQDEDQEYMSIDVTEQVQDTFMSYHRMFGTKNVDFNFDSSAFKNIDLIIKGGKDLIKLTQPMEKSTKYRLILFCIVSGEKFYFEVCYDKDGLLDQNRDISEKDDLNEYLKRNINKLYLQGRSSGVSKQEFMSKTSSIPFLHDLVRVETFYRDRVQNTLKKKTRLQEEVVVLLNIDQLLIIFRFQTKMLSNVEGEIVEVGGNDKGKSQSNTYRILMIGAYQEDVIADLRERITQVLKNLIEENIFIERINKDYQILEMFEGTRDFMVRDSTKAEQKWKKAREFERIARFSGDNYDGQIVFKLEKSKYIGIGELAQYVQEREEEGYDCYSLYKHQDFSYEWRLCKIIHKEPFLGKLPQQQVVKKKGQIQKNLESNREEKKFYYWIEFLHLKQLGQQMWLKRKREEIVISARYAREQQRNFEQESLKFIKETYTFRDEDDEHLHTAQQFKTPFKKNILKQ